MFQEIDNVVVGGNITGTMTTVEVRLSNACERIERDVYTRLCYACVAPVTFEFVPADFDLCQPLSSLRPYDIFVGQLRQSLNRGIAPLPNLYRKPELKARSSASSSEGELKIPQIFLQKVF